MMSVEKISYHEPSVAVLMATYNGERYLPELLESLLCQRHKNFTLFIRDDGSTDKTVEILKHYSSMIKMCFLPTDIRLGPALGFMKLLEAAGSAFDFYAFCDQDDVWTAEKLLRGVEKLTEVGANLALYHSRLEYVDKDLHHLGYSNIVKPASIKNALVENVAVGCTVMINRAARKLVLQSLPRQFTMHDWWIYLVIVSTGRIVYDPTPTIKYRQHESNTVGADVSFIKSFYKKAIRFINRKHDHFGIYGQAVEFKKCFFDHLTQPNKVLVNDFVSSKENICKRLTLVFSSKFYRQYPLDSFILRVLFALGKY